MHIGISEKQAHRLGAVVADYRSQPLPHHIKCMLPSRGDQFSGWIADQGGLHSGGVGVYFTQGDTFGADETVTENVGLVTAHRSDGRTRNLKFQTTVRFTEGTNTQDGAIGEGLHGCKPATKDKRASTETRFRVSGF